MNDRPICFVIAPIGKEGSPTRNKTRKVYEDIIKPACRRRGYSTLHAMEVTRPGLITNEIIRRVVNAPLVIADLTDGNANVFYELALRHAVGKPFIQLLDQTEAIPFNLKDTRTIRYDIDNIDSRKSAIQGIVSQMRNIEEDFSPLETPISAAGMPHWTPFPEEPPRTNTSAYDNNLRINEVVDNYLQAMESAEKTPQEVKNLLRELRENPLVYQLDNDMKDLETACLLIESVLPGGSITGTSSLQYQDADEHKLYRIRVNKALEQHVKYTKIICCSNVSKERRGKWMDEFTDKANLIVQKKLKPGSFRLLHCPFPLSVDVLISRDKKNECDEMVAGFAGGDKHGGFHTRDKKMVTKWFETYVQAKVMSEAEAHTQAVMARKDCPCYDFLKLLEDAYKQVMDSAKPASPKREISRNRKGGQANRDGHGASKSSKQYRARRDSSSNNK